MQKVTTKIHVVKKNCGLVVSHLV